MFCHSIAAYAEVEEALADKAGTSMKESGMEWKGHISGQKVRLVKVISDREGWEAIWLQAFRSRAPEIDFDKYAVACVFLGHKADWLYSISFGKPYVKGNVKIIPYSLHEMVLELMGPFKPGGQYHMKAYRKSKGLELILKEPTDSVNTTRDI